VSGNQVFDARKGFVGTGAGVASGCDGEMEAYSRRQEWEANVSRIRFELRYGLAHSQGMGQPRTLYGTSIVFDDAVQLFVVLLSTNVPL
jgi:hypothetical protein